MCPPGLIGDKCKTGILSLTWKFSKNQTSHSISTPPPPHHHQPRTDILSSPASPVPQPFFFPSFFFHALPPPPPFSSFSPSLYLSPSLSLCLPFSGLHFSLFLCFPLPPLPLFLSPSELLSLSIYLSIYVSISISPHSANAACWICSLHAIPAEFQNFFFFPFSNLPFSDIDECSTDQHNCDVPERGICNNTHGSFLCHCRHGYCGEDGRNCKGLFHVHNNILVRFILNKALFCFPQV